VIFHLSSSSSLHLFSSHISSFYPQTPLSIFLPLMLLDFITLSLPLPAISYPPVALIKALSFLSRSSQPLAHFITLFPHLIATSSLLIQPRLQLTSSWTSARLIRHPNDGGCTHLWNVKSTATRLHGTISQKILIFKLKNVSQKALWKELTC
jgi:hypothetical protein